MNSSFRRFLVLGSTLVLAGNGLRADEEQNLIAVLQSPAGASEKSTACLRLRSVGTARAVPALAALLSQAATVHAARNALEALPYPEAGAALRAALGQPGSPDPAGLVDSLGWRGEPESVPVLVPFLSAPDAAVAAAAATALGRIGGKEAATALTSRRSQAPPAVLPALLEGLLRCADRFLATGDRATAAGIYGELNAASSPPVIRAGAWRGLALADHARRGELLKQALAGSDRNLLLAGCKLARELDDRPLIEACLREWASLPPESQWALLDAHVKFGNAALPTVRVAWQSPHPHLRVAAILAVADLNAVEFIPGLARAAAAGQPAERDAARETLARIRGAGVREALLEAVENMGNGPEQAELLRALGERGDREAGPVLLRYANSATEPVRVAACESLRRLALPSTLAPLLDLAAHAPSDAQRETLLRAIFAICQADPDKRPVEGPVLAALDRYSAAERRLLLPVLAELGTPNALAYAQKLARDPEPDTARQAVRVLGQWPDAAPALSLLELAQASADTTLHALAVRGGVEVTGHEPDQGKRLALLQRALTAARRADEKRLVLGQIGQIASPEALTVALEILADPELRDEAGLAAVAIAEKLAPANAALAEDAAVKVLANCKAADTVRRAWALRRQPAASGPFIRDWVVCGPYRQAGVAGAEAVFNLAFGPEKPGEQVEWKAVPPGDSANLAALFPGEESCVAYLRAQIVAPADQDGVLLMGSDDGVKAWLNGELVHSHNVDRGQIADQDRAPIKLRKGQNQLVLKITQGGGGWSACARIVGTNGQPIAGLKVDPAPESTPAAALPPPAPPPAPKPATLPPRDSFKKVRLADPFYAEGAYYGDFDRDGRVDIVAGPYWYNGPEFQRRHEYRIAQTFDPKEYSDNFLTFAGDFNADGWTDILCVPFPGKEGYWYANPAGKDGPWARHLAYANIGNESPVWGDVTGDGQPELVFCNDGYFGYAGPDPTHPDEPWVFHAVTPKDQRFQQFTHGAGLGDLNGDRRPDVIVANKKGIFLHLSQGATR